MLAEYPDQFETSVSWTTRKQRQNEVNGVDYFFKTVEEFKKELDLGGFIEYSEVHGNFYGTHKSQVEKISAKGKICILEIDIKGAKQITDSYPKALYVFINVKDPETLRTRLIGRGSETEESLTKRLNTAKFELENYEKMGVYQMLYNEDLEDCFKQLVEKLMGFYKEVKF